MGKKRKSYSAEFKVEAVRLVKHEGISVAKAAEYLGITENMLWRWKKEYEQDPEQAFPGKGHLKTRDEEMAKLRKEIVGLRQERDILKKAVSIFSRMPK